MAFAFRRVDRLVVFRLFVAYKFKCKPINFISVNPCSVHAYGIQSYVTRWTAYPFRTRENNMRYACLWHYCAHTKQGIRANALKLVYSGVHTDVSAFAYLTVPANFRTRRYGHAVG